MLKIIGRAEDWGRLRAMHETLAPKHLHVLLVQVRDPKDAMGPHEADCVRRRLAGRPARLTVRNALAAPASADWLAGVGMVIIGGSGAFSVHDPRSGWFVDPLRDFLEATLARDTPGFGVCFGHQLLGVHLGHAVITDPAHAEVGTITVDLTDAGAADPVFGGLPGQFSAQTGHSDSIIKTPAGVDLLATTPTLDTQAFRVRGTHFYSAQFHPDLTGAEAHARYQAYRRGLAESGVDVPDVNDDHFIEGADDAAALLGSLADTVIAVRG